MSGDLRDDAEQVRRMGSVAMLAEMKIDEAIKGAARGEPIGVEMLIYVRDKMKAMQGVSATVSRSIEDRYWQGRQQAA